MARTRARRSAPAVRPLTTADIDRALATGEREADARAYFGDARFEQLRAMRPARAARGRRPRVLILPGIMGSMLGTPRRVLTDTIWLNPANIALGRTVELALGGPRKRHTSTDVIPYVYYFLRRKLTAAGFDADYHHYDWRLGLHELGAGLAAAVAADPAAELSLVAHSMGGLVARAALKADPGATAKVARLIQLGTPNHGSFNIVQALTGGYEVTQRVAQMDLRHDLKDLTEQVFGTFPGVYAMLPFEGTFHKPELFDAGRYPRPELFPRPRQPLLDAARAVPAALADPDPGRFYLIAGIDQPTATDVTLGPDGATFDITRGGDGTVPLRSALLPRVKTTFVPAEHGALPNDDRVGERVVELLRQAPADWVGTGPPADRGERTAVGRLHLPQPIGQRAAGTDRAGGPRAEAALAAALFAPPPVAPAAGVGPGAVPGPAAGCDDQSLRGLAVSFRPRRRLELKVVLGDLTDVDTPAGVLGAFSNIRPGGPAAAVDRSLSGAVGDLIARRMFTADVGQVTLLPTAGHRIGPQLVLFAGLGEFDRLTPDRLRFAAANVVRYLTRSKVDEFACVVFGANSGFGFEAAVENLLRGFLDGLDDADPRNRFRRVILVDRNRPKYDEARRTVRRLATDGFFGDTDVFFDEEEVRPPEPPPEPRDARAPARATDTTYLFARGQRAAGEFRLDLSLLAPSGGAALQGVPKGVPAAALDALLKKIDRRPFDVTAFGAELAGLALPGNVAEALARPELAAAHLTVVHDREASRLPWETLRFGDHVPATAGGLSRRYVTELSVAKWLHRRREQRGLHILLVVNPTGDLEGAEQEAAAVRELLARRPDVRVTEVVGDRATRAELLRRFGSGEYDVIHYAGHAAFDPADPGKSGVLCADRATLSGDDLTDLTALPALFFCNACESGKIRKAKPVAPGTTAEAVRRTLSFAEAFLVNGVSQFIGTYWPVGDDSAKTFATEFYKGVTVGAAVGTALLAARKAVAALSPKETDWADYMHYGDPRFVLKVPPNGRTG